MTEQRTYRREHVVEATRRWDAGQFGPEWRPYRALAASRGFIFPPAGDRWDSWEDGQPSQRAIVYRAIEDTPRTLRAVIARSRSWNDVVRGLMADLERRREDVGIEERAAVVDRLARPTRIEAMTAVGAVLDRIRP